jgi:hypothetical protein
MVNLYLLPGSHAGADKDKMWFNGRVSSSGSTGGMKDAAGSC